MIKNILKNSLVKPRTQSPYNLKTIIPFFIKAGIATPMLLFCMPLTILYSITETIYYKFKGHQKSLEYVTVTMPNLTISHKRLRKYDTVVFGCTGYTGGLLVDYLAKTYGLDQFHEGKQFKWAIIGRNESKLKNVIDNLSKKYPGLESLEYIVADTLNFSQVEEIVNQTRVVITTVGPYSLVGNELINACALYGTDYVDITGESHWYQSCINNMQDLAVKSGARLINFCGHDSIPWDLCTYFMHEEFKNKYNQDLKKIQFYDQVEAHISGGTISSIFEIFTEEKNRYFKNRFPADKDPWFFVPGEHSTTNLNILNKNTIFPHYDFQTQTWSGFFIMAELNYKVVQRSNVLVGYGNNIEYGEKILYKNFIDFYEQTLGLLYFASILLCKPLWLLARKFILPRQGEA